MKVELGCSLAGFEEIEGGVKVKVAKEISIGKEDEEAIFDYVVGADGARSESLFGDVLPIIISISIGFVRKALGIEFIGETRTDAKMYLLDAVLEGMHEEIVCGLQIRCLVCNYSYWP